MQALTLIFNERPVHGLLNRRAAIRWPMSFIERLLRSLKYECVFLSAFETGSEAPVGIGRWIGQYSATRPHSSFGGRTPDEVYAIEPTTERLAE